VSRITSSTSTAPVVPRKGGCVTEKVVKVKPSTVAQHAAGGAKAPPRFGLGEVFKVDRLLASKGTGAARHFIVRWQKPYNSCKDDSDELACDVSKDLIKMFDFNPQPKAPWKDSGWYYIVERVLDQRMVGSRKQCKVSWSGYPKWKPVWIDEDQMLPAKQVLSNGTNPVAAAAAQSPSSPKPADEAKHAADLEACNLPCAAALTRKRKMAPLPRASAEWVKPEASEGERQRKRQQKSAVPKGAVLEVEALLASRPIGKSTRVAYLVRWKGFDYHEDCWEPATNIEASLVAEFEDSPLPKVSLAGRGEMWLIEKVLERQEGRSLVRWLGYGHRPDAWVESQRLSMPTRQTGATPKNAQTQPVSSPPTATERAPAVLPGERCAWVARAMELLVKPKVNIRMVAFQVERAAAKAGETIDQSGFDAVLEEQQALKVPEERILALQDALGL